MGRAAAVEAHAGDTEPVDGLVVSASGVRPQAEVRPAPRKPGAIRLMWRHHGPFAAPFLWIPALGKPDPYYILLILYVVTQVISTELMLVTQSDPTQKWIMRAMPIMFVFFLFRFPAGLFVYWVTTNIWTIGQQLLIRKVMKPKDLATMSAKPAKRSRIMEVYILGSSW